MQTSIPSNRKRRGPARGKRAAGKNGNAINEPQRTANESDGEADGEPVVEGEVVAGDEASEGTRGSAPELFAAEKPAKRGADTLSHWDPLKTYMRDIQRYPLLKPEEEYDLAVKYFEHQDVKAAERLVTSNLRLVVKIAYDYRRAYRNLLDLVQEGNIGLMQAVKKYDPYKGVKLSSYASWWIRAYILRFILNNWRLVKVGTTQAQRKLFFNLKKEKARLSAMGIEPTPERIAERLNVSVDDVVQMDRRLSAGEASLDAPVGNADGRVIARVELLPARHEPVDDQLARAELDGMYHEKIHEFGARLQGKDALIFQERLLADEPKTLQELATVLGVSRERVRQLEKRIQRNLAAYLRNELGEEVVDVQAAE